MPTCLVVQHVAPESPFAIAEALVDAGVALDIRRVFAGAPIPGDADGLDGLVVMGGPMSAASDAGFPSRGAELALIRAALAAGVPTLGVCLGAQLVALAAGADVYPGQRGPEIGWSPVTLTATCAGDPLFDGLPDGPTVLQWHGDTFDLPRGATLLAENATYANQAFAIGTTAWGLQFHIEVTVDAVEEFLAAFGSEVDGMPGGTGAIRRATPAAVAALQPVRHAVLHRFAGLVAARVTSGDLVREG